MKKSSNILGVLCSVEKGYYTFTVPGGAECTVYGKKSAQRTIRGRLDASVRNTMGEDWCAKY